MKTITVKLPDGYDECMTITAMGQVIGVTHVRTNVTCQALVLDGHDGETLVIYPNDSIEWRKPETRWIPVTERLPEGMQEVLVFTETIKVEKALYNCAYKSFDKLASDGYRKIGNVTHWMPLPESPEEV